MIMVQVGDQVRAVEKGDVHISHTEPQTEAEIQQAQLDKARLRNIQVKAILTSVYGENPWRVVSYHARLASISIRTEEQQRDLDLLSAGDVWQEQVLEASKETEENWPAPPPGLVDLCRLC